MADGSARSSASTPLSRRRALGALGALALSPLLACGDDDDPTDAPRSSDASLAGLALSAGTLTPSFATSTVSYTAAVGNATSSITVTPTASHGRATITVNNAAVPSGAASAPINLSVGPNAITILVTAEDGTSARTYALAVTRSATAAA